MTTWIVARMDFPMVARLGFGQGGPEFVRIADLHDRGMAGGNETKQQQEGGQSSAHAPWTGRSGLVFRPGGLPVALAHHEVEGPEDGRNVADHVAGDEFGHDAEVYE